MVTGRTYKAMGEWMHDEQEFYRDDSVNDKVIDDVDEPCCKSCSSVQQGN